MVTAWSTLTVDTSPEASPSLSTCTRAPSMPRMIGRPTPGPWYELWIPGSRLTVSPSDEAFTSSRRSPASTSTGWVRSSADLARGLARTMTESRSLGSEWRGSSWLSAKAGPARSASRARNRGLDLGKEGIGKNAGGSKPNVIMFQFRAETAESHAHHQLQPAQGRPLWNGGLVPVRGALRAAAAGARAAACAGAERGWMD